MKVVSKKRLEITRQQNASNESIPKTDLTCPLMTSRVINNTFENDFLSSSAKMLTKLILFPIFPFILSFIYLQIIEQFEIQIRRMQMIPITFSNNRCV
jgi:hypothetical protein